MNDKLVLIKERYDLTPVNNGKDNIFYLEAPVAVFGQKNNNKRIYEESNYLPLLEELQEKIKGNNLTGELDHPGERLEVFLANVSHKIEEIKYDKDSRTVKAKIRLIEGTTAGNNAIALHRAGVNLGISSRAIGVIKESKALLKKIITFDIVSTPGFKTAMLKPINESLGYSNEAEDLGIFEITDQKYLKKYAYLLNEDNNQNENEMADKDFINQITESLNQLRSEIEKVNEKIDGFADYNQKHIEELNEFASTILETNEDYKEFKNKFVAYNENETNKLEELRENVNIIDETMDSFIKMYEEYSDKQTDKLNMFVDHQDTITEKLNDFVDHQHNESQKLNDFALHQHNESEKLNYLVEYLDKQSQILEQFVDHQHNEAEKMNHLVNWSEENLSNLYESARFGSFVNRKKDIEVDIKNISESVNAILDNARKQKALTGDFNKFPFLNLLEEEKVNEFLSLDDTRKTIITKSINETECKTAEEVLGQWKKVTESIDNEQELKWLAKAPEQYQKLWESLAENKKANIIKLAGLRNFKTQEQINEFWSNLKLTKELELIKETENFDVDENLNNAKQISENWKLGYSKKYIEQIKELVKKNKY